MIPGMKKPVGINIKKIALNIPNGEKKIVAIENIKGTIPNVNIPEYDKKMLPNAVRLVALYVFASIDFSSKLNFGVTCGFSSMLTSGEFSISLANVCMIGKIASMIVMIKSLFIFYLLEFHA
jgi:hypothetical protein